MIIEAFALFTPTCFHRILYGLKWTIKTNAKSSHMNKYILPFTFAICVIIAHKPLFSQTNFPVIDKIEKKSSFSKLIKNKLYLTAGMNFSKQTISLNSYSSKFIYDLNNYNKNLYKPGYFIGIRYEGNSKRSQKMMYAISLEKLVAGSKYLDGLNLPPFLKYFTPFKADDQLVIMSLTSYYKQEFPFGDMNKYKLSLVLGPSMNIRLSEQSPDNLINKNYKQIYFSGNGGIEFNNPSFYTVFVHYKLALSSFTKTPIQTNMNSVEIGTIIKTSDLF